MIERLVFLGYVLVHIDHNGPKTAINAMIPDSIVFIAFVKMILSDSDSKGKRFHA